MRHRFHHGKIGSSPAAPWLDGRSPLWRRHRVGRWTSPTTWRRRLGSAGTAVVAAAGLLGAWAALGSPPAAAQTYGVLPVIDCVSYDASSGYTTVYWGYDNTNGGTVTIPAEYDFFDPSPITRGQPFTFAPGYVPCAFETVTLGAGATISSRF